MPAEDRNSYRNSGWILEKLQDFSLLKSFDCGDDDLNEFFRCDAFAHKQELLAEIYSFSTEKATGGGERPPVAFISFHNDAIQLSMRKRRKILPPKKVRYRTLPAVKIGRLGVEKSFQRKSIGTHILNMSKKFFLYDNRTGCRFITMDAYNHPDLIRFYEKNEFQFLTGEDENQKTRIMYFDLKRLLIDGS